MILYKYMSWPLDGENHARELIESDEIYLSRPTEFNDPYDIGIIPVIEGKRSEVVNKLVEEILNGHKKDPETFKNFLEPLIRRKIESYSSNKLDDICNDFIENRQKTTAVLCFTDSPFNMLMWSHYADSHKGICLEFNTDKNDAVPNIFEKLYRVEYTKNYPKINFVTEEKSEFYRKVYATKYHDWRYEHEYRAIYSCAEIPNGDGETEIQVIDSMIGAATNVSKKKMKKCEISPQTITSVICGCKMPQEQIDNLKEIVAKHKSQITIKKASPIPNDFGIDIISNFAGAEHP